MKPLPRLIAAASLVAATVSVHARIDDPASTVNDVRGLWVLRTSLTNEESIRAMVRAAEAGGFNTLLVQVRGRGEAFYKSAIEPRASDLDGQPVDFDPLATTLTLAHRAGLRVHAWINVNLVASGATLPRSRDHVATRHPEWLMVPKDLATVAGQTDVRSPAYVGQLMRWTRAASDRVEGLYLSPIPEASQAYTVGVIHELVERYALDGIHLDYARYPGESFDYSPAALSAFRADRFAATTPAERQRLDRLATTNPLAWTEMYPEGWARLRRDRLTELVTRIARDARATRKPIVVSAAVTPNADDARDDRLQDWAEWASSGTLDVVCPMAYATGLEDFTAQVTRAQLSAGRTPVWTGIGAYLLPVASAREHVRAARRAGASGVLVFSYDSLSGGDTRNPAYLTELRSILLESPGGAGR